MNEFNKIENGFLKVERKLLGRTIHLIKDQDFREILPTEFISENLGLIAGLFLIGLGDNFKLIPGLLMLIPGFLELQGNILSGLAGRLTTKLFMKKIKPKFKKSYILNSNIYATLFLVGFISTLLGVIIYFTNLYIFKVNAPVIILISFLASIISTIIILPTMLWMIFILYKRKFDPDDIMGPYITSLVDVLSVMIFWVVIKVMV